MEIGGYFQLEHLKEEPYYPDLIPLNLGRTALTALLGALHCTALFVPAYLCDSVTDACRAAGFEIIRCPLDDDLIPIPPRPLRCGEYLYLVNYYGQLTDTLILQAKERFGFVIVDHTQAFFQRPLPEIPTLYSVRKYFGVSDGAYLSWHPDGEEALARLAPYLSDREDESRTRLSHLLGRFEGNASDYYQEMLQTADSFHAMPPMPMSALTRNILGAIDYRRAKARREENYAALTALLPGENPFRRVLPEGPFAYPFEVKDGLALRRRLAQRQIYIPTYWSNVLRECPPDSPEYRFAADILPLPCDQRYTPEDMKRVAATLLELL